jgi:hypothetical protein
MCAVQHFIQKNPKEIDYFVDLRVDGKGYNRPDLNKAYVRNHVKIRDY